MIFNQTGGGGSPELQTKTVAPSTSQQLIVPDTGFDGLSQVTVTPALLETKSVTPSTNQQVITPGSGYYGMGQVTVSGARLQSKSVVPSSSSQIITPDNGYIGLSDVTVRPLTARGRLIEVVNVENAILGFQHKTSTSNNLLIPSSYLPTDLDLANDGTDAILSYIFWIYWGGNINHRTAIAYSLYNNATASIRAMYDRGDESFYSLAMTSDILRYTAENGLYLNFYNNEYNQWGDGTNSKADFSIVYRSTSRYYPL